MHWLRSLTNENDYSVSVHTVLSIAAFCVGCGFQGFALWHGQDFDVSGFGTFIAQVLGGGAMYAAGIGYCAGKVGRGRDVPREDR